MQPTCAHRGLELRSRSCPSMTTRPRVGFTRPTSIRIVVVFPAPFGPEEPEDLAPVERERDVGHDLPVAVALREPSADRTTRRGAHGDVLRHRVKRRFPVPRSSARPAPRLSVAPAPRGASYSARDARVELLSELLRRVSAPRSSAGRHARSTSRRCSAERPDAIFSSRSVSSGTTQSPPFSTATLAGARKDDVLRLAVALGSPRRRSRRSRTRRASTSLKLFSAPGNAGT